MATDSLDKGSCFDRRFLGLGLYWAWLFVTFYTPVLFPGVDAAADVARDAWSWAAWAHALSLIACAGLGRRLERFAESPSVIVGLGVLSLIGTGLVPLSQVMPGGAWLSWGLAMAGAVLTGCTTAGIVLLYGRQFARVGAEGSLVSIMAAYLLSCIIYFFVRLVDPLIAIATTLLLPAAASFVLLGFKGDSGGCENALHRRALRINPRVLIPLAMLFMFALGGEMFRGFAVPAGDRGDLEYMGDLYMAGGLAGLLVLGVWLFVARRLHPGQSFSLPDMQAMLVVMALSFLCTVLFGASYALAYAVFGAAFMACRCIVWAYCSDVAGRATTSSLTVFGVTQASFALAVVVGVPLSQRLAEAVSAGMVQWDAIATTFLFLIVVVTVLATKRSDFESAWGLVPRLHEQRAKGEEERLSGETAVGSFAVDAGEAAAPSDSSAAVSPTDSPTDSLAFLQERFGLTPREYEVAVLLARGRSLPFVQRELHISQGTAQSHLTHIYQKFGVHSRQEFIDVIDEELGI